MRVWWFCEESLITLVVIRDVRVAVFGGVVRGDLLCGIMYMMVQEEQGIIANDRTNKFESFVVASSSRVLIMIVLA